MAIEAGDYVLRKKDDNTLYYVDSIEKMELTDQPFAIVHRVDLVAYVTRTWSLEECRIRSTMTFFCADLKKVQVTRG